MLRCMVFYIIYTHWWWCQFHFMREFSRLCSVRRQIKITWPALCNLWESSCICVTWNLFLIIVFFSFIIIGRFSCCMLTPRLESQSVFSLPLMPQCAVIHCRTTPLLSSSLDSLSRSVYSPCQARASNTDFESVKNTTFPILLIPHLVNRVCCMLLDLVLLQQVLVHPCICVSMCHVDRSHLCRRVRAVSTICHLGLLWRHVL